MKLEAFIENRSQQACELCGATEATAILPVEPLDQPNTDNHILACAICKLQIEKKAVLDPDHWKGLSESMWSEVPGVQVTAWRMLNRLKKESWAADLLDILYLDDEKLAWAKAAGDEEDDGTVDLHRDSNGTILSQGDAVVLTKSLDVKGSTLNAKMGTVVKNIRLVENNTEQIEGRIEGQVIIILTKYVRKQGN